MATVISDLKTTHKSACADPTAKSLSDAKRKIRIHVTCIIVAGIVSTILYQTHIGNALVLGMGPVGPSIIQEVFDRLLRL
jgi:hypothetical protein